MSLRSTELASDLTPDEISLLALWREIPEHTRTAWRQSLEAMRPRDPHHERNRLVFYPPVLYRLMNVDPARVQASREPITAMIALPLLARWLACRGVKPAEAVDAAWGAARTTLAAMSERVIRFGLQAQLLDLWEELERAGAMPGKKEG